MQPRIQRAKLVQLTILANLHERIKSCLRILKQFITYLFIFSIFFKFDLQFEVWFDKNISDIFEVLNDLQNDFINLKFSDEILALVAILSKAALSI